MNRVAEVERTKIVLNLLRFLATVLFIALAIKAVRWDKMAEVIQHSSFLVAIIAATIYACLQCLSATRWWSIARASNMSLRWRDAVAAFYTGMFFNLFLPGLVGGDAVRAILAARRTEHSLSSSFGIVYADRTVGFIAMLLVGTWGAATLHLTNREIIWQPLVLGALFAVGVTAMMVAVAVFISRQWKSQWGERIGRFANGIVAFLQKPKTGTLVFAIALTYHLSLTLTLMLLGQAAGIVGRPFSAYAMVVAIATVIGSLPISLHGLGVRELASVKLWALLQVPAEQAMFWALLWRVMAWLVSLPGGIVYLLWADRTVWQDLQTLAKNGVKNLLQHQRETEPFTIPKSQRVDIAIATLEQLLEETDDETIREALSRRLEQLREEREQTQRQSS
ncbi:MAG: flippase-like domain-containing protein [Armatimonadetes bacterium]|nr:flippase-like domain-containing protein [Armatimonadota bacterium]